MEEHFNAGFMASSVVCLLLFMGYMKGLVPTINDLGVLMLFGVIGIIIGSDLPDIDSRTAPIHDMFGILTFGIVTILSLGYFELGGPTSLFLGLVAVVCYIKLMPPHRRFIHTVRGGLILAGIGAALMQIVFHSIWLSVWMGFSLFIGHMVHLTMDKWIRF